MANMTYESHVIAIVMSSSPPVDTDCVLAGGIQMFKSESLSVRGQDTAFYC